ncbi:glycerol-3-phosphate 1-O-acyltransferase PlsY [Sulfoacidibacillus thermotolerans]|uniref:Glycerol-3-phosphate acyltransferase n=1 Tax=Sulfoacidibacillus thermotolerans TaxID=1765684 RepID=A0A2U3DCS7_SULT2|nr:glycerol-3-phosphate 1-O-acyltransferase PlsY [Sulfoacidibacillus thermotolerans]PWI59090.1 acyl-phosphate glycerol 3-phosphate acyltransferase [Sulfoacidibacillus thermotolerans]
MVMLFLSIIFAYLLGAISSSYIAGKVASGVDIRDHGSGNAGATNTLRVLGPKLALLVLVADIVKGILAIAFAHLATNGSQWAMALSGLAAIIGHNWPIYFNFRGGKGVATTIGVLATLSFPPALYAGLVAIALLLLTRYVSLAALTFVTLTPIFQIAMHTPAPYIWVSVIILLMTFWRHRTNITRLRKGVEHRIFSR